MPRAEGHDPAQAPSDAPTAAGLPAVAPTIAGQEEGGRVDNAMSTDGHEKIPVVGLGGSAGGLAALQSFFSAMPAESGMAFVVIMHLSPEHESLLAELLQRTTSMPVRQVQARMTIQPNHVYVISPGANLTMTNGSLAPTPADRQPGRHLAVDLFFRTLADTQGPRSVAIVLSGADGDGAICLKRVKERGGLTIAQLPEEAEHGAMPRAAINTGLVDWVLPVAEMPARIVEYWRGESQFANPADLEGSPEEGATASGAAATERVESTLHDILGFLRVRTGHDFTYYKRATVLRRIARRMKVNGIGKATAYLDFIRSHAEEPGALLKDLLISVTNFFRDRDAFAAFEARMPILFRDKRVDDGVRVWVAGCATGEEAYSVAMLLHEYAARLPEPPPLQVFATDLDENAIQSARDGVYPETIAADVSEERLRRFFSKEHGGYRVRRELRETVLFALHDLLKDSPFSRLDAVTCRNLLIYLNHDAQLRALEIFHFALRAEGTLFVGSSESVEDDRSLFNVVDKKRRIFARGAGPRIAPPLIADRSTTLREIMRQAPMASPGREAAAAFVPRNQHASAGAAEGLAPVSWSNLHYEFIERLGPPSVLVNHDYQIVHTSEHAGQYLQMPGGETSLDLLKLVHPMLRVELRAALYQATQNRTAIETHGVPVEMDGGRKTVNLRVAPSHSSKADLFLVIFEELQEASEPRIERAPDSAAEPLLRQLEEELERTKWQLRNTIEQSDASTEELKATNEEFQAMNEELRSTTEELETGREELQSVNEELSTVNQELKSKVEELGRSNSDLQNLMASTQIATLFLDARLCIQRYTPPAVPLFRLIPTDVGRPLDDLAYRLSYPNLKADAERVLDELVVVEVEVAHEDGRHFLARMLPYRTAENVIAGVVMTFVDITRRRKAEETLDSNREQLRVALTEAESAARAKDHFLAVLSHELRTPLTPVKMAADMLGRQHDLPVRVREALEMIQRNVQIEMHLIDDLLDITRIARGQLEIVIAPMDLHQAVRGAIEISNADIHAKKQALTVALDAAEHTVNGDASRLRQVFWNLVKNASKFTPEGGSIHVVSRNEPGQVVVEVTDTGIGLEAGASARIFESFAQATNHIARKFGGLGLGLSISKAVLDAHSGTLTAKSDGPQQGASFIVTIPLGSPTKHSAA
jgi:two-component system CheB/CheR fusion protein